MKINEIRAIPRRIYRLATGKYVWIDRNGSELITREHWHTRWAIDGIHLYDWRWIKRFGSLDCGCSRNPLTRKFVIYNMECPMDHGGLFTMLEGLDDVDDDDPEASSPEES